MGTTNFSNCKKTSIQSPLLESIISNKYRKHPEINPVINSGHGIKCPARHLLSFILRSALNVNRIPGYYDIEPNYQHFKDYDIDEIRHAIVDARRIYEFGQNEMKNLCSTINLSRGLRGKEAQVAFTIADSLTFPFRLPLQTFTFFNHVKSPFIGDITLNIEAPVRWVWASAYTLLDLEYSSEVEDVILVVDSLDGCIEIYPNNIVCRTKIEKIDIDKGRDLYLQCLEALFFRDVSPHYEIDIEFKAFDETSQDKKCKSCGSRLINKKRFIANIFNKLRLFNE